MNTGWIERPSVIGNRSVVSVSMVTKRRECAAISIGEIGKFKAALINDFSFSGG